jgi:hypothetical protein
MYELIKGDIGKLSEQLKQGLQHFANFIDADLVEYKDRGNSEELTIHKYGKSYIIKACGNKFDGGFFGYAWGDEESVNDEKEIPKTIERPPYILYNGSALRKSGPNSYYRDGGDWTLYVYEHGGKLCGRHARSEKGVHVEIFPTTEEIWREDNGTYAPGYVEPDEDEK